MIRIIPRSAWTDTPPGGSSIAEGELDSYQHHDAGPGPKGGAKATRSAEEALIRGTRAYHVNSRGMSDIAYSLGVMPSGRVYALRGRRRAGGHTYGHNSSSYGVVAFGNYESSKPSPQMVASLRALYARMIHRGWVSEGTHPTGGHRDVGAQGGGTSCPGRHLYAKLDEIRRPPGHHHHSHLFPHRVRPNHHHRIKAGTPKSPHHPHVHRHRRGGPRH